MYFRGSKENSMIKKSVVRTFSFFLALITMLSLFSCAFFAVSADSEPRKVKVGVWECAGMYKLSDDGTITGFGYEYMTEIAKYNSWELEYVTGTMAELQQKMKDGTIDVMLGIYESDERNEFMNFSTLSVGIAYALLKAKSDNDTLNMNGYKAFDGITVGFERNFFRTDEFALFADEAGFSYNAEYYQTKAELKAALQSGEVDAALTGDYICAEDEKPIARYNYKPIYAVSSKKCADAERIFNELNSSLEQIASFAPFYGQELYSKYFIQNYDGSTTTEIPLTLTSAETEYIQEKKIIKPVYANFVASAMLGGKESPVFNTISDICDLISERTGLEISDFMSEESGLSAACERLSDGSADVICAFPSDLALADKYGLSLSAPYMRVYFNTIINMSYDTATTPTLALVDNIYFNEYILNKYPDAEVMYFNDYVDCFNAVNNGTADISFANVYITESLLSNPFYNKVYSSNVSDYSAELCFALPKNPGGQLLVILNKAIASITDNEYSAIVSKNRLSNTGELSLLQFLYINPVLDMVIAFVVALIIAAAIIIIVRYRRSLRRKTEQLQRTDSLTKSRNAIGFSEDAAEMLKKTESNYAVVYINIRNFRYINDLYGTGSGDELLLYLNSIIEESLTESDIHARIGADNFIVLKKYSSFEDLAQFFAGTDRKVQSYGNAVNRNYVLRLYAGIYIIPEGSSLTVSEMTDRARIAMDFTNDLTNNNYVFFEDYMMRRVSKETDIIKNMKPALENEEFTVYLQPQHHLQCFDSVKSAEALVRWIKPNGAIIPPNDFITVFEKNGFITQLDRYVYVKVCEFIKENYNKPWYNEMVISVNVSRIDLFQRDFIDFYSKTKDEYGIPDGTIELEFTESAVFDDFPAFVNTVRTLSENGFNTALDDFGVGSSSLNSLKKLPVDVLKMDKGFFDGYNNDSGKRDMSVIASVVAMAKSLGMRIVAEGIEKKELISFLREIGCDAIQGYVYSKPLPIDKFISYVENFEPMFLPNDKSFKAAKPFDDDIAMIDKKYHSVRSVINALVFELDVDNNFYRIVTYGTSPLYFPVAYGTYSMTINNYINERVMPEDREKMRAASSIKKIMSDFYSGNVKNTIEYRAKFHNPDTDRFENEYHWFSFSVHCLADENMRAPHVSVFVQDINESKMDQLSFNETQNHLDMMLSSLHGAVYCFDMSEYSVIKLRAYSEDNVVPITEKNVLPVLPEYAKKNVHPHDLREFLTFISTKKLKEFTSSDRITEYIEYRVKTTDNDYIWHSGTIVKSKEKPHLLMVLIQNIDERKKTETMLATTERRLYGLLHSVFAAMIEVNLQNNTYSVIKPLAAYRLDHGSAKTFDEYILKIVQLGIIHPQDLTVYLKQYQSVELIKHFALSDCDITNNIRVKVNGGYSVMHVITAKDNDSPIARIFVRDTGEREYPPDDVPPEKDATDVS